MTEAACRVLVVDDTLRIRELLADYLETEGFEVRTATNGRDALEVLDGWRPDLIVLDLSMPEMDGWSFRSTQLEIAEVAEIPVLVFSATSDQRTQIEALRAAVLPKTCDLDLLVEAIRRLVAPSAVGHRVGR